MASEESKLTNQETNEHTTHLPASRKLRVDYTIRPRQHESAPRRQLPS